MCIETDTDAIDSCEDMGIEGIITFKDIGSCPDGESLACKDPDTGATVKIYGLDVEDGDTCEEWL